MPASKRPDPKKNITTLLPKEEMISSQHGHITYLDWCRFEVLRMRKGSVMAVVADFGNLCAVARH